MWSRASAPVSRGCALDQTAGSPSSNGEPGPDQGGQGHLQVRGQPGKVKHLLRRSPLDPSGNVGPGAMSATGTWPRLKRRVQIRCSMGKGTGHLRRGALWSASPGSIEVFSDHPGQRVALSQDPGGVAKGLHIDRNCPFQVARQPIGVGKVVPCGQGVRMVLA